MLMQALCIWLLLQGGADVIMGMTPIMRSLTRGELEELAEVSAEVITTNSPCSATCGLGVKEQKLCFEKNGKEGNCRVRQVTCLESWQCGLTTVTLMAGQRLEMDCLGDITATGRYSWRVAWRYAHGIITSDNTLFSRWDAPQLKTVVLDPVRKEDAGTYRCDIKDKNFRRLKRVYWGVRVLPRGILNLDYDSSLAKWDGAETHRNLSVTSEHLYQGRTIRYMVLISAGISSLLAGLTLVFIYWWWISSGTEAAKEEQNEQKRNRSRRGIL